MIKINKMKKILFMSILSIMLSLVGCNREKKYLKEHQVIYYGTFEFEKFEKNAKINKEKAYKLGLTFSNKNGFTMGNNC